MSFRSIRKPTLTALTNVSMAHELQSVEEVLLWQYRVRTLAPLETRQTLCTAAAACAEEAKRLWAASGNPPDRLDQLLPTYHPPGKRPDLSQADFLVMAGLLDGAEQLMLDLANGPGNTDGTVSYALLEDWMRGAVVCGEEARRLRAWHREDHPDLYPVIVEQTEMFADAQQG